MKQRVHSVSYLAKAEFEFKNGVYDLVALPAGAEVVKVSLELIGDSVTGDISVGFEDESTKGYFFDLHSITPGTEAAKLAGVKEVYTATSNKVIVAKVGGVTDNSLHAKGVVRALYFLPSTIEVEY